MINEQALSEEKKLKGEEDEEAKLNDETNDGDLTEESVSQSDRSAVPVSRRGVGGGGFLTFSPSLAVSPPIAVMPPPAL